MGQGKSFEKRLRWKSERNLWRKPLCVQGESMCLWELREGASIGEVQRMEKGDVQSTKELIGGYGAGNGPNNVSKLISKKPVN